MLAGLTTFAIFTASVTSGLNAAAIRRIRGLRQIHRKGHVIVCGAGNVGSLVIDYLRELDEQVVVVEKNPDGLLIEMARDQQIDLLTGDATNDETITFCSPEKAKSLVGVTNSDTANLEAALGARSRTRERGLEDLHLVLRVDDLTFGRSIKRHFGIASFSTTELTAPTIAGLARFESTRGRFDLFPGSTFTQTFQLAERFQGPENAPPPAPPEMPGYKVRWVPLYAWRDKGRGKGEAVPIHKFEGEVQTGDRLLFMVPLDQFQRPKLADGYFRGVLRTLALLGVGDTLPAVTVLDDRGEKVKTTDLLGGPLILYFYPKDDTPGCTSEASQFRDIYKQFQKKNARVVGVSRDSVESHQKFKKKYSIPFALLADTESKLCDAFGVIVEKTMYGKKRLGIQRSTFSIDEKGKIVNVWPRVSVDEHAEEVLSSLS